MYYTPVGYAIQTKNHGNPLLAVCLTSAWSAHSTFSDGHVSEAAVLPNREPELEQQAVAVRNRLNVRRLLHFLRRQLSGRIWTVPNFAPTESCQRIQNSVFGLPTSSSDG
jgi:hypothetical protein